MKLIFTLLFLGVFQIALSANQPRFEISYDTFGCNFLAAKYFAEFEFDVSALDPAFAHAYEKLRLDSAFPACEQRLKTIADAKHLVLFLWGQKPELFCQERLKDSSWPEEKIQKVCSAAHDFDLVLISNSKNQNILIAGESHVKDGNAAEIGKTLVSQFQLRGLEGFSGNIELGISSGITGLLVSAFLDAGIASESTILTSREQGLYFSFNGFKSILFENGKINNIRNPDPFSFLKNRSFIKTTASINIALERSSTVRQDLEDNCPRLSMCNELKRFKYLVQRRNEDMANTLRRIQTALPDSTDILVLVGSQHVPDLSRLLTCQNENNGSLQTLSRRGGSWQTYFTEQRCDSTRLQIN